jgi:hypothetical protein
MSIMTLKVSWVPWFWQVSGSLPLPVTTKATVDTFAKFTSSTSPEEFFQCRRRRTGKPKGPFVYRSRVRKSEQDIARGMENTSLLWACC